MAITFERCIRFQFRLHCYVLCDEANKTRPPLTYVLKNFTLVAIYVYICAKRFIKELLLCNTKVATAKVY